MGGRAGLHIHRSERADQLVAGLARLLADAPADPFTPDVVAVPSRGVERWIAQSLSASLGARPGHADGVCAGVTFPPPGRLVRDAVAGAVGFDPDADPWDPERLAWHVLAVIDGNASAAWCGTLARHLGLVGDGGDRGRRVAVAQKFAGLFASYGAQRPAMLLDWRAGRDTDGRAALGPDHAWQAELWRQVRAAVGVPSPAERTAPACERLRAGDAPIDLPARLSVFGPTRLTTDQIQVLDALATHRDVHLWLPHPSDGLWARVRSAAHTQPATPAPARLDDPTVSLPRHPLLRSLARDARELQLRLPAPATDEHLPPTNTRDTLLATLQRELATDQAPGAREAERCPRAAGHTAGTPDTSVQVHACHGRHRQVEVLREVLLGLLADEPSLELRDILVMCPDIEAFAPLLSGLFSPAAPDGGAPDLHPGHQLTVRLADRSPRQVNPLLDVAARLLELARLTVSEVLDFAALPAVRRRFGFDDDALDRVGHWARTAGVRFGLDAESRRPWGLAHVPQNTWRTGWDRVLLGVAMDEDELRVWDGTLPLDDVDSTDVDLAGRFAEYLDRLGDAVAALGAEQPLTAWVDALDRAVGALAAVADRDSWQVSHLQRILSGAVTAAGEHAGAPLGRADIRAVFADALAPRPSRANFRTGNLTICTMVPMRSVPHRVVVLLGIDDGVFPRATHADGDDVLALHPRIGERDARSEDRQLFLDAILAATETLVILHTGADERTGAIRPPAVPLGELLDVLERTRPGSRARVVTRHPLQPFDARNFSPAGPFSFDKASFAGGAALAAGQSPRPPFLVSPLPDEPLTTVSLDTLVRFLEHPAAWFMRTRLQLPTREDDDDPSETLPVALGPLEAWAVGNRVLQACLAGTALGDAVAAERVRGEAPPGTLGEIELGDVEGAVSALLARSAPLRAAAPDQRDVVVGLPNGVTLAGTVGGLHGRRLVRVLYSRLSPKHRLRAWVQLLALAAAYPDAAWTAHTLGRGAKDPVAVAELAAVDPDVARATLTVLVEILRRGGRRPLPLAPRTSCTYAEARATASPAAAVARATSAWTSRNNLDEETGECGDTAHRQVWGDGGDIAGLLALPPDGLLVPPVAARVLLDGPAPLVALHDEPHLFGQLARLVWDPLLAHEKKPPR